MSSLLAIASVTAVLKHLLENGLAERSLSDSLGGSVLVTALPPDQIPTGSEEQPRLNLYMHQVAPNTMRRREGAGDGRAMGLDLHYLISAYGAAELQCELLIGGALHVLRRETVLAPPQIRAALASLAAPETGREVAAATAALVNSSLPAQLRELRFEPQFLSLDDLSKIWSSLQARARPSVGYKASLVVIE